MKILSRRVVLDEHTAPPVLIDLEAEERGEVGDARGLLHVVGDDHDRVVALQLVHQLLDRRRGDRVERRRRLVQEQHLGLDGDARGRCRAAAAGRPTATSALFFSRSLTSSHSAALRSAFSTRSSRPLRMPSTRGPQRDVVVDRLRERIRPSGRPCRCAGAPRPDRRRRSRGRRPGRGSALDPGAGDEIVHAVEAADEGALPAARRADDAP